MVRDALLEKIKNTIGNSLKLDNLDDRVFGTPTQNPNANDNVSLNIRSVNVPLALLKKTPETGLVQGQSVDMTVYFKEDKNKTMKKGVINGTIERLDLSGNYANIKMNNIKYDGKTITVLTKELWKKMVKIPGEFNFVKDVNNFYTVTNVPLSMLRKSNNSLF